MNTRKTSICLFVLFVLATVSSASAFKTSDFPIIEFADWDHSQIMAGGQSFADVCGDVDVVVTASGAFSSPSEFGSTSSGFGSVRFEAAAPAASQAFTFAFSEAVPIVIDFDLLDSQEQLTITTDGSSNPAYTHVSGQLPVTSFPSSTSSSVQIQGAAVGPNGAAIGFASLGLVSEITVAYDIRGAGTTKFNAFTISKGTVVPEPNSQGLLAMGLIGLFGLGRKRRSVSRVAQ